MTWKCPVCGYENSDDALFCIQCGTKKPENIQPETQQTTPEGQPTQNVETLPTQQSSVEQPTTQNMENSPSQQSPVDQSIPQPTTLEQQTSDTTTQAAQEQSQVTQPVSQPDQGMQQVLQTQPTTGKYYIIFIATPVSALNKSKLPLDFDVFESVSIGRSPENVIVIPDPEISRRHAIISLENGKLYIEDLNSTNGTYMYDGKLFQPVKGKQEIIPGSIIKLGSNTMLKIVIE
ncbi:FHA domain-containing protein [Acidianus sp. HS-5]|uniref:FHA domain-containing protein n=1 Tax=Acidianus sp. HS-5 TaxID=2886040 RepID=UPI001F030D58|nr:FHA domain-containing protein [Acidianus sp. HS-5]BDC19411.1 hypothetical protein HS5_23010 [Acidianus sp. HS-5]